MLSGHRSAWRRRSSKSRAARIAVPLAIPMALGLTLGIILAISSGNTTKIAQSALGSCASPSASASAARGCRHRGTLRIRGPERPGQRRRGGDANDHGGRGRGGQCRLRPASPTGRRPFRQLGDVATAPVDGGGQRDQPATRRRRRRPASMNCTRGRAGQPAERAGPGHAVAARRRLLDGPTAAPRACSSRPRSSPPNGQLQVYNPLVITAGHHAGRGAGRRRRSRRGSQVIIRRRLQRHQRWSLTGRGARQGNCVDALGQSADRPGVRSATRPTSTTWPTSRSRAAR